MEFLRGMCDEMDDSCKVVYDEPLDKRFQFPIEKLRMPDKDLSETAQKLRFRHQKEYDSVKKDLDNLDRKPIEVRPGIQCPFEAICIQVFTPPRYNGIMLRHQAACFMAEFKHFFFPLMEKYLKDRKIGFSTYLQKLYCGDIWCDEYVIGAIAKMWNIRITITSPFYSPPWDVFHSGAHPHVVLIANGSEFGKVRCLSHISSTRGKSSTFECVKPIHRIGEISQYYGRTKGSITGAKLYEKVAKRLAIEKATKVTNELDDICKTIQSLTIRKNKLLESMQELNMEIDHLKQEKYRITEVDYNIAPKLAPLRRVAESMKRDTKKDTLPNVKITTDELEHLMNEFAPPDGSKTKKTSVDEKDSSEKLTQEEKEKRQTTIVTEVTSEKEKLQVKHHKLKPSHKKKTEEQTKISKFIPDYPTVHQQKKHEEKAKSDEVQSDKLIRKLVKEIEKKTQRNEQILHKKLKETKGKEEELLPSLGQFEGLIDQSETFEPGVVTMRDIKLPVEEDNNDIEELDEYSGKYSLTEKERTEADKYLYQENVIQRSDFLPRYEDLDPNLPDNTPCTFHNIAYEKGVVDTFLRLEPKAKEHLEKSTKDLTEEDTRKNDNIVIEEKTVHESQRDNLQQINVSELDIYLGTEESPKKKQKISHEPVHQTFKKTTAKKMFKCQFCSKQFSNITYRNKHEERMCDLNPNPKLIQCECGKTYRHESNYKDHRSSIHGDVSRHICKLCGRAFPHQNSLARHKTTVHKK